MRGHYRTGILVLIALAVLTGIEYVIAVSFPSTALLFLVAIMKGALVLYYFMHVTSLWSEEGGH